MAKKQSGGGGAGDSHLHVPPAKKAAVVIGSAAAFLSALAAVAVLITAAPEITARTRWSSTPENFAATAVEEEEECDVFDGSWVFDDGAGRPLYSSDVGGCRYITDDFACERWGRKDTRYQQWRWQPRRCDLPRFDGKRLLERLRGKRMVFVGDSNNRNQFFSMICLLDSHLPHQPLQSIGYDHGSSFLTYKAIEYNATIEFYWSPLLVESNRDSPENYSPVRTIVMRRRRRREAREAVGRRRHRRLRLLPMVEVEPPRRRQAFEWAVDGGGGGRGGGGHGADRRFSAEAEGVVGVVGVASGTASGGVFHEPIPDPFLDRRARQAGGRSCYNETELVAEAEYRDRAGTNEEMAKAVADAFGGLRSRGFGNICLLNITRLSEYWKDGHPTIFKKF